MGVCVHECVLCVGEGVYSVCVVVHTDPSVRGIAEQMPSSRWL